MKKLKESLTAVTTAVSYYLLTAHQALATGTAGINPVSAETMGEKILTVFKSYLEPIGAVIVFITIAVCAIMLMVTSHKPEARAKVVIAIPFIFIGGVLLGGCAFFAGVVIGAGQQLQS